MAARKKAPSRARMVRALCAVYIDLNYHREGDEFMSSMALAPRVLELVDDGPTAKPRNQLTKGAVAAPGSEAPPADPMAGLL